MFKNKYIIIFFLLLTIILFGNSYLLGYTLDGNALYCVSDIAIDMDSGTILYGKNHNEKVYPASTTKILTAILTIENLDLKKSITVSQNAYNSTPYGSSVMGVKAGETFTVEDLLYGLLLPSGNDAALVLAEAVSGNVDNFVYLMNQKLEELNITNTHFVNPHGFHDDNHYSTASDMAKLLRYCLQNDTFKKIISTLEYTIPPTNITAQKRVLRNTNRICDPLYTNIYYENILGGKTGYTYEANGTFVGYGSKDDKNIIVCTFNGSQNINGNQARFLDAVKLANYCFDNFEKETIKAKDYSLKLYNNIAKKSYILGISDDFTTLINKNEITYTKLVIQTDFNLLDLISSTEETSVNNTNLGYINIYNKDNVIINTLDLKYLGNSSITVNAGNSMNYTNIIIITIIVITIMLFVTFYTSKKR